MNNVRELSEKLQDIKIQIGVEEKLIKKKMAELSKKHKIKNIDDAKRVLKKIDKRLTTLDEESTLLKTKAIKIISQIEGEDGEHQY